MGMFKKKGPEVIDLADLRHKGILQRSQAIAKKKEARINEEGIVDLSLLSKNIGNNNSSLNSNKNTEAFGFLSNLASVGNEIDNVKAESTTASDNLISAKRMHGGEIQSLKIKIEDIEYKVDRFIERLDKIEKKLEDA